MTIRRPGFQPLARRASQDATTENDRVAAVAGLFLRAGLPVILFVANGLGGAVGRHIKDLIRAVRGRASLVLLQPSRHGVTLTIPGLSDDRPITVPAELTDELLRILSSIGVTRVHVHHTVGLEDLGLRRLIRELGVPFDLTIHDWYSICPQITLQRFPDSQYCGEPDQAACNLCITDRPSRGAQEILLWRSRFAWLLREAERVLCSTEDVLRRLVRYTPEIRAVLAPHEPSHEDSWMVQADPSAPGKPLRVVLPGVLADHKGGCAVRSLAEATEPTEIEFLLIGRPELPLPPHLLRRIKVMGAPDRGDLPAVITRANPHVVWFPEQAPEGWSYELTAAIDAGCPIVASRIGGFPERLRNRPLTWLLDPASTTEEWRAAFRSARAAIGDVKTRIVSPDRPAFADYYSEDYLKGALSASADARRTDVQPAKRLRIIVVPECNAAGVPTPRAYIRLIQPLDHLAANIDMTISSPDEALHMRADILVTQRYAIQDPVLAEALCAHCLRSGMKLLYDMDENLIQTASRRHEAARRILLRADSVWVASPQLATIRADARIMPDGLDERLWFPDGIRRPIRPPAPGPVRILLLGQSDCTSDFAIARPALSGLADRFDGRIAFDLVGVANDETMPSWVNKILLDEVSSQSYPRFVNLVTQMPAWDIGIAPMVGSPRAQDFSKILDYAALGLAIVASDVCTPFGSSVSLVGNTVSAWTNALDHLIRYPIQRAAKAQSARIALDESGTLSAQRKRRLGAWLEVAANAPPAA